MDELESLESQHCSESLWLEKAAPSPLSEEKSQLTMGEITMELGSLIPEEHWDSGMTKTTWQHLPPGQEALLL